jgi:hypothetical protein
MIIKSLSLINHQASIDLMSTMRKREYGLKAELNEVDKRVASQVQEEKIWVETPAQQQSGKT